VSVATPSPSVGPGGACATRSAAGRGRAVVAAQGARWAIPLRTAQCAGSTRNRWLPAEDEPLYLGPGLWRGTLDGALLEADVAANAQ
jgi:hypothetical protein